MSAMVTLGVSMVIAIILQVVLSERTIAQRQVTEEVDIELRALLIARRDALKDLVRVTEAQMDRQVERNAGGIFQMAKVRNELYRAELELTESKKERIEILAKALEAQAEMEDMFDIRQESKDVVYYAKAERIKIEIELHKEKKKP